MYYHYSVSLVISLVVFLIIAGIKRKSLLWILLLSLSLLPFIALLSGAVYSIINGSGLVGDSGGIDSGLFAIIICFVFQWYIYIPSLILLIVSFYKVFLKKTNH